MILGLSLAQWLSILIILVIVGTFIFLHLNGTLTQCYKFYCDRKQYRTIHKRHK